MSRPEEYLSIPADYGRWLGVRWSADRDAIEHTAEDPSVGLTFVMAGEIAAFLEGFHAVRSSINFAYVLNLLKLLNNGLKVDIDRTVELRLAGSTESDSTFAYLEESFQECGRPLRNAGFLCGHLCRDVPRVPNPPDLADLGMALHGRFSGDSPQWVVPEEPSLEPEEFEERVRLAMRRFVEDGSLEHWLRHGRGPIGDAGEKVAEEADAARPRTLLERLEALGERPRLSVAAGLVPHLDGALILPSRRLTPAALPVGGYSDVTTRGQPEQILPAQFALDDLEFLRRFAARELLYFHREEPRSTVEEELVLVMDQGVRTWGDVRLVLSAAGMALARRSARPGVRLLVASTGTAEPRPAAEVDDEALATGFEGSDLSTTPADALEWVLATRAEWQRDVVLLTHPRALNEDDVREAAARVEPGTRLFAVAVDAAGAVNLAELRRGVAVPLSTCRVTIPPPTPSQPEAAPGPPSAFHTGPRVAWRGDVEPIAFPFALGAVHPIGDLYALDDEGKWLLAATTPLGLLMAWKVDGTSMEILPRCWVNGAALSRVKTVVGVADGFVVVHAWGSEIGVVHYDFGSRTCTVHSLHECEKFECAYLRNLHAITFRNMDLTGITYAIDLGTDRASACYPPRRVGDPFSMRAKLAATRASFQPKSPLGIFSAASRVPEEGYFIRLNGSTGTLQARTEAGDWTVFTPYSDGRPTFNGGWIIEARSARNTLAVLCGATAGAPSLQIFAGPRWQSLGGFPVGGGTKSFALSIDGRTVAYRLSANSLQVRSVGSTVPRLTTTRARVHNRLEAYLGGASLVLYAGRIVHRIRWNNCVLQLSVTEDPKGMAAPYGHKKAERIGPGAPAAIYDRLRFISWVTVGRLTAVVDVFGHVAVLDQSGATVVIFFVFRRDLAAWLPDGTVLGPAHLIGGPSTPRAPERIAEALHSAGGVES